MATMLAEAELKQVRRMGNTVEIDLHVQRDLEYFPHHFPGQPMLPGVVQLGWAIGQAQRQFGLAPVRRLSNLKFLHPIAPGLDLVLRLERAAGDVAFSYATPTRTYSSGRLRFADGAA
ncbi:MAG TPA: hypothetical protein VM074_02615 [Solimonas sp.]|nr:hypothetical protein [Solimonas sp.]